MARPKRKVLKFDEQSVNNLLQEIYNEAHNIRSKIARLFSKWEVRIKDNNDITLMSDAVVKLIQAEAKNQDQKIMLLKYLKEVVFIDKKNKNKETETINPDAKQELIRLVNAELENENIKNGK